MASKAPDELGKILGSFRRVFLYVAFFSFIINLLMLVPSVYMLQLYDRVMSSRNMETLLMLTLIMLFLMIVMGSLELIRTVVLTRLSSMLDERLSTRIFDAAFERNLKAAGGNPVQALSDLASIRQFLSGIGIQTIFDIPWFPLYLAVVFLLHPWLGWLTLSGASILLFLTILTEKITAPPTAESNRMMVASYSMTNANLGNAEVIEAMGMLGGIRRRWLERHKKMLALQSLANDRAGMISAVTRFVRVVIQSLLMTVGTFLAIDGQMTGGVMIVGAILGGRTMAPVEMLIGSWKQFLLVRESYQRLNELLTAFPMLPSTMDLPAPKGVLTVGILTAAPPKGNSHILRNVVFELRPGEILGVIGPSATGKSTLARMLVGVWRPSAGSVRLDGAEISQWKKEHLGPYVGYLPQDVELFSGTVAENIARFGEIDPEKVTAAAQQSGVHDMILHLPKGYDTEIGMGGAALSGGQRQRLALARALYGAPVLVVLDEPNSNLDDAGDRALLSALRSLKESEKTVVLISHRSVVLSVVDKILLLRSVGEPPLFGPRDQVLAALSPPAAQVHPLPAAQKK
ncbi:Alkaline protease secretion ATP-binding protein AprD [Gammaproteobacteria bacterium]